MLLEPLVYALEEAFKGQVVPMRSLEVFVTEKTDFLTTHLRTSLKKLEAWQRIRVTAVGSHKRRRGTFPSDKVEIAFIGQA